MMLFEKQNVLKTFQSAKVLFKKKKVEVFKRHFQTWCLLMAVWFFMATYGISKVVYLANHNFYLTTFTLEVEPNWTNIELIFMDFFNFFSRFESMDLKIFELKEFQTNPISDNLNPTSSWSGIKWIKFELIFIEFFEYLLPFRINRIANYWIERISNKFQFDLTSIFCFCIAGWSLHVLV